MEIYPITANDWIEFVSPITRKKQYLNEEVTEDTYIDILYKTIKQQFIICETLVN